MSLPRLYPILDTALLAARGCPLETAADAMLEGGARILQIRHKGHWPRDLYEQAERIANAGQRAGIPLIVNDRADIAVLLRAGLHVGQDDIPPVDARRLLGAEAILGFSTHNAGQLSEAAAEPVTYLAIGPIFATQSKIKPDPVVGLDQLRAWKPLTTKPLVAIGGITRATARSVLDAGASSLAVISDLLPPVCSAGSIRERLEEWRTLTEPRP